MNKIESNKLTKQIYTLLFPTKILSINEMTERIYDTYYNGKLSKKELRKLIESKIWYAFKKRRLFKEKKDYYSNSREVAFSIRWNPKTRNYLGNKFQIVKK